MSKKQFDQLIRSNIREPLSSDVDRERETNRMEGTRRMKNARWIAIDKIHPDPDQPRKDFPENSLQELADSIKEHGVLQPIVVEFQQNQDRCLIVHGERRYKASQMVGLRELPCVVQDSTLRKRRFAQQLVENIQREDLSPIDKARALLEYKAELGENGAWAEVEQMVGISETRRKQFIRLLQLPEEIQREIVAIGKRPSNNHITEKHARALLMLNKMPDKQSELFEEIKNRKNSLTGDAAIEKAKSLKGKGALQVFKVTYKDKDDLIEKLAKALAELKGQDTN